MKIAIFLLLLAPACEPSAPSADSCVEFDRATVHNGAPVTCRMVWCESGTGVSGMHASGLAMLWCEAKL